MCDGVAVLFQVKPQQIGNIEIVLDDENRFCHGFHLLSVVSLSTDIIPILYTCRGCMREQFVKFEVFFALRGIIAKKILQFSGKYAIFLI